MQAESEDFPVYHIEDLFPDQLALIKLLGSPPILGSCETSTFLVNPAAGVYPPHYRAGDGDPISSISPPHAVLYTCPVIAVLEKPRMVLPSGDLHEVQIDHVCPPLEHWRLA